MTILDTLDSLHRAGIRGIVLTGNIWDLVPSDRPTWLVSHLASGLAEREYLGLLVSRSMGGQLLDDPRAGANAARERVAWVQRMSGLRLGVGPEASQGAPQDLVGMLSGVGRLLSQRERKVAVIVDYPQHLAPATRGVGALAAPENVLALELMHRWGVDPVILGGENRVIMLSPDASALHEQLRDPSGGYRVVHVDLPDLEARRAFVRLLEKLRTTAGADRYAAAEAGLDSDRMAALGAGLRLMDIEGLSRRARAEGRPVTVGAIRDAKAGVIRQMCDDLLEIVDSSVSLDDVKGLPGACRYLGELCFRLERTCADAPRAILLMGVPGCGKTFLTGALARTLGWNCLAMRNIHSMWVGESERNLERVFSITAAMVPCVFFIDEIDQALARRGEGGDAGTSRRMLKRTMEFLADERHRGRVLFVAATNAPHALDPAIDDRFTVKIPFLHPTEAERRALLPALAGQLGRRLADDVDVGTLARSDKLTVATVRSLLDVIERAAHWTDVSVRPGDPIGAAYLDLAVRSHHPNHNPLQHELIALTAIRKTSSSVLYPWMMRDGTSVKRDPGVELPPYLAELVDASGEVDDVALDRRLDELGRLLHVDAALRSF